ncbi:MAG: hypothetical protein RSC47_04500 [Raoultibacter sp.]
MKTCPICKARCFDDMKICYGCMHQFEAAGATSGDDGRLQKTAMLRAVADPFDEKEKGSMPRSAEREANQTHPSRIEEGVSCAVGSGSESAAFFTPSISLEELFSGKEYRLEIRLCPCKKEEAQKA